MFDRLILYQILNRDERIWTFDLLLPKQTRYQTALRPDDVSYLTGRAYTHQTSQCQNIFSF